ncbi:MAG: GH32 C-terminal domain-containing protein [Corynebacterium sp.]|uniref:GH32 C-terminal domain-containing protein n=1 Tax=Corynebacterium sp. TaxID=1720 RepID=UPI0026DCD6E3|nr:GH32 C-terminal domain-containing protein [Corynebacterium sp.]MDO4762260.1 GH32 C-terminal domain-containing protein [Corynebacterium sp.]
MTHRPELHVTLSEGILDAPAGALFDGYSWHLFNQYRPNAESGCRWAHQVSHGNPFSFEICDDVLAPEGDEISLRAGSVTAVGEDVTLYYTSVSDNGRCIRIAHIPEITLTTETIGEEEFCLDIHVEKLDETVGDCEGFDRFRSPCVVPNLNKEGWLMLAVTGSADNPTLVMLESDDGRKWNFLGPLMLTGDAGLTDSPLVAPRIVRLKDEVDGEIYDVLIVTIEHKGIDVSGYLVGRLEGTTFEVLAPFNRIDHGHDFTRPRNTNRPSSAIDMATRFDEAYLFGLMNGVGRMDRAEHHHSFSCEGWANCLSLPRRVSLQNRRLYQTPFPGILAAIEESDEASMWTGIFEVPEGESLTAELIDSTGQVSCTITHYGDRLELDRSMNAHHHGDAVAIAPLGEGDTDAVTVIADGSTVEVFADGGQVALASRVYFNGICEEFRIEHTDGVTVERSTVIEPTGRISRLIHELEDEGVVR